jgi:hypothetical protein
MPVVIAILFMSRSLLMDGVVSVTARHLVRKVPSVQIKAFRTKIAGAMLIKMIAVL